MFILNSSFKIETQFMHTPVFSVYFDGFSQLDISTDRGAITQNKSWDIFTMSVGFSFPPSADFFHTFKTSGFQDTYYF